MLNRIGNERITFNFSCAHMDDRELSDSEIHLALSTG